MRSGLFTICGFIVSGISTLSAQDSPSLDYSSPTAPFVAPVPDKAQWTITLDYNPGPAIASYQPPNTSGATNAAPSVNTAANALTSIQSIKTGRLKHDVLVYANEKRLDYWYANSMVLTPSTGGGIVPTDVHSLIPTAPPDSLDPTAPFLPERGNLVESAGFPGLDWVEAKYYVNVIQVNKEPCYHYLFMVGKLPFAEAWINAETKLPVQYAGDGVLYKFAFGSTPTTDLVLPPAYSAVSSAAQEFLRKSQLLQNALNH